MKKLLALTASLVLVVVATNAQADKKDPPPPPPPPPMEPAKPKEEVKFAPPKIVKTEKEPPVITVTGKLADEFYQRNPSVSEISRKGHVITIKNKDGSIEKYDTSKNEEDKSFSGKYGKSPIPPPPPPKVEITKFKTTPAKPKEEVKFTPPKIVKEEELKPPVITIKGKLADEFYQRNPTVSEISRRGNIITIKKKDGTTEEYDISNKDEDKNFTDRYGRSPIPPPPPKKTRA